MAGRTTTLPFFKEWMTRMKGATLIQRVAVSLAVIGFCFPQLALAATLPSTQTPLITDVELREGGVLLGQVVTPENAAMADTDVSLSSGDQLIAAAKTDNNGYFAFAGLGNGVYQLAAAEGHAAFRVWTPGTAPPAAQPGALVVAGSGTVRAQGLARGFRNLMSRPLIVAGIIAAAIAIPVAIHNADRGSP